MKWQIEEEPDGAPDGSPEGCGANIPALPADDGGGIGRNKTTTSSVGLFSALLNFLPGDQARTGSAGLLLKYFLLLFLITAAIESTEVVAMSSFLAEIGVDRVPIVWIASMMLLMGSSVAFLRIADRVPRRKLLRGLMIGFALVMALLWFLSIIGVPERIVFTALYLVGDVELGLLPLAFWTLASDTYDVRASLRLFPIIAAGSLAGNVFGNWGAGELAIVLENGNIPTIHLVVGCSAILIMGSFVPCFLRDSTKLEPGGQPASERPATTYLEDQKDGFRFVWNVGLFRHLLLIVLFNEVAMTLIEFYFLVVAELSFPEPARFQQFYGTYKAILALSTLPVQLFLASRLLKAFGLRSAFVVFPTVSLLGIAIAAVGGSVWSAASLRLGARVVLDGIDCPARRMLQSLIPSVRMGRVATLLDIIPFAAGTMIGCVLILVGIHAMGPLLSAPPELVYLGFATLVALINAASTVRFRMLYQERLLDWQVTRRRRRSVSSLLGV